MTDLASLAVRLVSTPPKVDATSRRIRATFNGVCVFDTTSAKAVWENPRGPQYYVPVEHVKGGTLATGEALDGTDNSAFAGKLNVADKTTDRVVLFDKGPLAGLMKLDFAAADAWYEEDQEILFYPKNLNKRLDFLASSRAVRVELEGIVLAESSISIHLYETPFGPRYYVPKSAVFSAYLSESSTKTYCPYKGEASYYHVNVGGKEYKDLVWWYKYPVPESAAIAGMICFYHEKMDIFIDGAKQ